MYCVSSRWWKWFRNSSRKIRNRMILLFFCVKFKWDIFDDFQTLETKIGYHEWKCENLFQILFLLLSSSSFKTSSYHRTKSSFCVPLKRKSGSRLQAVSHHLVNLGFRILRSTGGKRNLQEGSKALLQ